MSGINLTSNIDLILGDTQNQTDFNVSFHLSDISANDLTDPGLINPSNYSNSNSTEPIFVRVQNKTTLCYNTIKSFDLVIAELPIIINPILTIEQCDSDEDNNGKTPLLLAEGRKYSDIDNYLKKMVNKKKSLRKNLRTKHHHKNLN